MNDSKVPAKLKELTSTPFTLLVKPSLFAPSKLALATSSSSLNLETAIGSSQKVQDFESESLGMGAEHSQKVKAAPIPSDYGSKDCAFWPTPIAVSRFKEVQKAPTVLTPHTAIHQR